MGHHNRHYSGDPYALEGAWSPPTSAANFCEEDYVITRYIAEFINSLTNITYVILALRYMYGPGSRGIFAPKWDFMALSLMGVGVASFSYHASLRQNLQFADDLSMLVLSWALLQATFTVNQSPGRIRIIKVTLAVAFATFSGFYVSSGKIIYHTIAFIITLVVIGGRIRFLFQWMEPPFPEEKRRDWVWRTWKAIFISLSGYLVWNIDLEICFQLREWREQIGLPWAFLLELHGWWHILTAIGASQFMDVVREFRAELEHGKAA